MTSPAASYERAYPSASREHVQALRARPPRGSQLRTCQKRTARKDDHGGEIAAYIRREAGAQSTWKPQMNIWPYCTITSSVTELKELTISASVLGLVCFLYFAALSRLSAALPTLLPPRTNLSVVGSGPTLCPGKSLLSNERMKLVFPTLYCPTISTIGLASKSAGFMGGE